MRNAALALVVIVGCKPDVVQLRDTVNFEWVYQLCGPNGPANQRIYDEDKAPAFMRVSVSFDCALQTLDGSASWTPVTLRGDRDSTATWCSARFGPVYVHGPVAPDTAVSIVEDPLLAALFRTAFVGIDPHRDYDLETDRAGVRLSAHQHRSNDGVELTLGVDGCKPSDVPEIRRIGAPLSFARP